MSEAEVSEGPRPEGCGRLIGAWLGAFVLTVAAMLLVGSDDVAPVVNQFTTLIFGGISIAALGGAMAPVRRWWAITILVVVFEFGILAIMLLGWRAGEWPQPDGWTMPIACLIGAASGTGTLALIPPGKSWPRGLLVFGVLLAVTIPVRAMLVSRARGEVTRFEEAYFPLVDEILQRDLLVPRASALSIGEEPVEGGDESPITWDDTRVHWPSERTRAIARLGGVTGSEMRLWTRVTAPLTELPTGLDGLDVELVEVYVPQDEEVDEMAVSIESLKAFLQSAGIRHEFVVRLYRVAAGTDFAAEGQYRGLNYTVSINDDSMDGDPFVMIHATGRYAPGG